MVITGHYEGYSLPLRSWHSTGEVTKAQILSSRAGSGKFSKQQCLVSLGPSTEGQGAGNRRGCVSLASVGVTGKISRVYYIPVSSGTEARNDC